MVTERHILLADDRGGLGSGRLNSFEDARLRCRGRRRRSVRLRPALSLALAWLSLLLLARPGALARCIGSASPSPSAAASPSAVRRCASRRTTRQTPRSTSTARPLLRALSDLDLETIVIDNLRPRRSLRLSL